MTRPLRVAGLIGAATVLALAAPPMTMLAHPSATVGSASTPDAALGALAGAAAWLVVCWLAVALMLATLAHVPGTLGSVAGAISRCITPRVVRRAIEAALGLTVATLP